MSVSASERLLDLIIALAQAGAALTREQIRRTVHGYAPDDGQERTTAAFERMFERDKEMLKDLGIPLVTVHGSGHYEDIRYRIDLEEYALPEINLSPAELGALALASHVWDGTVLARPARRGLTKLRGITSTAAETVFAPSVRLYESDEALPNLFDALAGHRPVRFTYAAVSTGEEVEREIEPWQLIVKDQGWYVRGWDRDRRGGREFRLSRITSRIRILAEQFRGPEPELVSPEDVHAVARLAIRSGAAAILRARGVLIETRGHVDVYEIPVTDLTSFAGEIAAHGPRIEVLQPPELRKRVIAKLQGAARAGEGREA